MEVTCRPTRSPAGPTSLIRHIGTAREYPEMSEQQYTEGDQQMHTLYAQGGQMYLSDLNQLTDEQLFYLAGHDPMAYFEIDGPTPEARARQVERRSKLIHNAIRARILLERRWVNEREQASRSLLERSIGIADAGRKLSVALVAATFALVAATIVLAGRNVSALSHRSRPDESDWFGPPATVRTRTSPYPCSRAERI
jgi:hypothetical protein